MRQVYHWNFSVTTGQHFENTFFFCVPCPLFLDMYVNLSTEISINEWVFAYNNGHIPIYAQTVLCFTWTSLLITDMVKYIQYIHVFMYTLGTNTECLVTCIDCKFISLSPLWKSLERMTILHWIYNSYINVKKKEYYKLYIEDSIKKNANSTKHIISHFFYVQEIMYHHFSILIYCFVSWKSYCNNKNFSYIAQPYLQITH